MAEEPQTEQSIPSKQVLRKKLMAVGVYTPTRGASRQDMQKQLTDRMKQRNVPYPNILWQIVLQQYDSFWTHLGDIRAIGLLASVCRGFRYNVAHDDEAWRVTAIAMQRVTKLCMQNVFLLTCNDLATIPYMIKIKHSMVTDIAGEYHLVRPIDALAVAIMLRGNAAQRLAHRNVLDMKRSLVLQTRHHRRKPVRWKNRLFEPTEHKRMLTETKALAKTTQRRMRNGTLSQVPEIKYYTTPEQYPPELTISITREIQLQRRVRRARTYLPQLTLEEEREIESDMARVHAEKRYIYGVRRNFMKRKKRAVRQEQHENDTDTTQTQTHTRSRTQYRRPKIVPLE